MMAKLNRSEFAYLFHVLFEHYRNVLSEYEISPPTKQSTILGYNEGAIIKEELDISPSNSSLSHVVYFTLKKRKYRFDRNGFSREPDKGNLRVQGGEFQNAYQEYNRGYSEVYLPDKYLNLYLVYCNLSQEEFKKNAGKCDNVPEEIIIPYSSTKPRRKEKSKDSSNKVDIVHDIFLAAPILTLATKIEENYQNFSSTLKDRLDRNYNSEVEADLIEHFFGFSADDLNGVQQKFENDIIALKQQLQKLELKVLDSREGISLNGLSPVAQSQERFREDIEEIEKSSAYILISPFPRLFSSAWVESGAAINMRKPCLFICSNRETDLPFVLQERSGSLNFDVSDKWNINQDFDEEKLESMAMGIQKWFDLKLKKNQR
ncbi:MAG: hypothetical protein HKN76_15475 [Saprospiraceae bacterium]|nr:hypothetical protein [Saprospiraceae bacterium]